MEAIKKSYTDNCKSMLVIWCPIRGSKSLYLSPPLPTFHHQDDPIQKFGCNTAIQIFCCHHQEFGSFLLGSTGGEGSSRPSSGVKNVLDSI